VQDLHRSTAEVRERRLLEPERRAEARIPKDAWAVV